MPFVINPNDGVRIYYDVVGEGPPVMLYYGAFRSTEDWYELGYVDAFRDECQLILVDSRGHGQSDGPHEAESYTSKLHTGDAVAVLDQMGIEKTHFVGYSMGGRIGFGFLKHAPERLRTMTIGGMHVESLDPTSMSGLVDELANGIEEFLAGWEQISGKQRPEPGRTRFLAQDAMAISAAAVGLKNEQGLALGLESITTPCLLYAGGNDPDYDAVKRTAELIPGAEFNSLLGVDHVGGFTRLDLVRPLVTSFLTRHETG